MIRSNMSHLTLVSRDDAGLQDFTDTLWLRLRQEAELALAKAPMLAPLFVDSILDQPGFEAAVSHRVSSRL
ncbi:MAG TPA: serine O-acetyltransferase, partial [Alphaproteobacteria bacterium]|nr:serine O-acetyltransferase [Alphaproteobacteria bacterium]